MSLYVCAECGLDLEGDPLACPNHGEAGARFAHFVPEAKGPAKMIILLGAIRHWWDENWNTPEHWDYASWRNEVSGALVAAGYLVYRPHEAFKGTWNERAQLVNDAAIGASDLALVLSDENIPSEGTDAEIRIAHVRKTPVLRVTSKMGLEHMLTAVSAALEVTERNQSGMR